MKIKVLQVCGQLSIGGQEMMVKNFFKYIDRNKFSFDYIVYGDRIGEYEKELISLGASIFHISSPSINNMRNYIKELKSIMKAGNYHVVHSHTYTNNGIVLKIAKDCSIPIRISHCHSTESGRKESIYYKMYKSYMHKLIVKNATDIIACGNKAGNSFYGENYFQDNGIVIKNGIDLDLFRFDEDKREKLIEDFGFKNKLVLAHVGHFIDVKNHKFLISVINELQKTRDDFILLLIGNGELMGEIKRDVIEKKLNDKVLFLGNRNDVNELLQLSDIVLCPSKFEGLPLSLVEAQAAGLKCIVSKNVSNEVNITGKVTFLDINEGEESKWCSEINKYKRFDRHGIAETLQKNGYDILKACKRLESIYSKEINNYEK